MLTMTPARWLLVLSLALSLLVVGPPPAAHAQAGGVTLNLVSWSYGVEIVRDNLGKFQQRYPGVSVNYSDFSWATYHDAMVARFVSKTPTDVLYSSDHWLQEWAAAGWIIPIDESFPQVRPYLSEYSPFVREALTYKGRIYGTPYYADTFIFVYNTDHLQRAGFTAVRTLTAAPALASSPSSGSRNICTPYSPASTSSSRRPSSSASRRPVERSSC